MNFKESAKELQGQLVTYRRDFHMEPEVSFCEFKTHEKIKKFLEEQGIEILPIKSDTSIVAVIKGGKPGKTFALRADIDALPMPEKKEHEYKSKHEGVMHSCGHDAHTAMLMGVATLLNRVRDQLSGDVRLLFQAAEEKTPGGAIGLVNAGALDGVDAIMAYHVSTSMETGKVGYKQGASQASADKFTIVVKGVGGHGAYPHKTIDPVSVTGQVISAMQNVVSRSVDPIESAVVTIASIHGGTKDNIIADDVTMTGTIRTLSSGTRDIVHKRMGEILKGLAISFNCTIDFDIEYGYPALFNNSDFIKNVAIPSTAKIIDPANIVEIPTPSMGAEDMAYYLEKIPGVIGSLGARNEAKGCTVGGHNSYFDIDEDCLWIGAACLSQAAWDFLN